VSHPPGSSGGGAWHGMAHTWCACIGVVRDHTWCACIGVVRDHTWCACIGVVREEDPFAAQEIVMAAGADGCSGAVRDAAQVHGA